MSCTVSRKVKVLPVEDVSMKLGLLRILLESCSPINIVYYILLPYLPSVCVWYGLRRERRGRVVGGDLSASSKHRAAGYTLRLCVELQTAVCFHILFGTCAIIIIATTYLQTQQLASPVSLSCLSAMHQSSGELLSRSSCRSQVSVPLISRPVPHYHLGGTIPSYYGVWYVRSIVSLSC